MKQENRYSQILCDIYKQKIPLSDCYSPHMMWKFAKSKDEMVRSDLAQALVYDTKSEIAIDILCKLAKDKDSLVRVQAVDSLSEFCCEKSYHAMKNALFDSDYLVRKYASFGLAWIGKNLFPEATEVYLLECEKREGNTHGKVGIYEGLYILGREGYIEKLIGLFGADDYQIKCSVLNSLSEIVDEHNISIIRAFINGIEREKYPKAVLSSLHNLEKECENISI